VDATEGSHAIALVTLIAATGERIGEALALRWKDVDLAASELHVRRSLAEVKGKFVLKQPKTAAGLRTISLPDRAVSRLRSLRRARGMVPLPGAIVFHNRTGGFLRKGVLYRHVLHPLLVEAGLPQVGWHAIRHAHATALVQSGEPLPDVAARLGHTDASFTLRVYAHALPDRGKEIAKRVDEILG
jgi:integrase